MIPRRRSHITLHDLCVAAGALFSRKYDASLVAEWEGSFARHIGMRHAVAVGSGRQGMSAVLESLGLRRGDEVIIPAYTLKALVGIMQGLGLVSVTADIERGSFNIDPASVREKITPRTRVILATHIFGNPCDIERIVAIARERSIIVLEDCAHAAGSAIGTKKAGTFGDAAFFSFETIKPINTYGGGMVVTNNDALAGAIRAVSGAAAEGRHAFPFKKLISACCENAFLPTPFSFLPLYLLSLSATSKAIYSLYRRSQRGSSRRSAYTPYQSRIGIRKLAGLEQRIALRRKKGELLKTLLPRSVMPQQIRPGASANYYFFTALLPSEASVARQALLRHGIDAGVQAEIADNCAGANDCPVMQEVFKRIIHLPLYEGITERQLGSIGKVLGKLFKDENITD
ncbi:MAG: aminotransferase class I/II-fold pyridoxal phosphate-dependent enzyme [Candidatus Omnitrophica bacterium]|nr:aminotransferase class I/II-fold pyridoxal phosphate-dependent enzyme [Candidatus Omnitrophota bacterium]